MNIKKNIKEFATFYNPLDTLEVPMNTEIINEIDMRNRYRLVSVFPNYELDKYNRVLHVTFVKPIPKIGETKCQRIQCPHWLKNVICWKCE
jgi:hypothetical protein